MISPRLVSNRHAAVRSLAKLLYNYQMDGILLVDKPAGWTSHDVVGKLRGGIKKATGQKIKVGHTGTLDPAATGLMILVVGSYTKRAGEFSKLDKTYEVEATLGAISTTGDAEGAITAYSDSSNKIRRSSKIVLKKEGGEVQPSVSVVEATMKGFDGQQMQTPPAYSAIKVDGQRAYKLARQGKAPKLEPRSITIYDISGLKYAYPRLGFTVKVSSGTYIRSLVESIGQKLGTGAYTSALRRTEVGNFNVKDAIPIGNLNFEEIREHLKLTN